MEAFALTDWDKIESLYYGEEIVFSGEATARNSAATVVSARSMSLPNNQKAYPLPDAKRHAKTEREEILRHKKIIETYRQKERSISRKRLKETLAVVIGIAIVAGMFGSVLYMQAQITSVNFQNNASQKRIDALRQETTQIREGLVAGADMNMVRNEALERLGMKEPGSSQFVVVELPECDKLITSMSYNDSGISSVGLAQAKEDLANYFVSGQ